MSITQLGLTGTPSKKYSVTPKRAATTITKTIGTSSRDYSTITAWEADLDNTLVYVSGDDAVGECYNDSVFTESPVDVGAGIVQSVKLTVAESERHDGTAGTGVSWTSSGNGYVIRMSYNGSAPDISTVEWIEFDCNGSKNENVILLQGNGTNDRTAANCIIHDTTNFYGNSKTCLSGTIGDCKLLNNIVYDHHLTTTSDFDIVGIAMSTNVNRDEFCLNNTVYNITKSGSLGIAKGISTFGTSLNSSCKNNIAMGMSGGASVECFTSASSTGEWDNNMSSDATADDYEDTLNSCLINKTAANQFVSIVSGSEDLHLKAGSDAIGAGTDLGTTPNGVQYDIDGVDRDARGTTWDIGADQAAGTVTKTIGTTARDYSTMTLWEADLDVATIYQSGDDAVGECYNDSTFDESVNINGGATVGLNSIELTVANGEKHDGTAGTGVRVVATSSRNFTLNVACTVKWIELDGQDSYTCYVYGNSGSSRSYINQMIIHNISPTSSFTAVTAGYANRLTALNTIVYKVDSLSGSAGGACRAFYANNHSYMQAYNCTAYSLDASFDPTDITCQAYGSQSSDLTAINCIGMDCQDSDFGNVIETYSISSDSTAVGTGCLANKTAANQFVSIVSGSEDLHLKAGSDAIGAGTDLGTTPDGVQYDIDGRDRDAEGDTWSIGADQFVQIISSSSGKNFFIFFY
jgi:hypothetical protein